MTRLYLIKIAILCSLLAVVLLSSTPVEVRHTVVMAQTGDEDAACDLLVQDAVAAIANTCLNLGRNEICYGNSNVSATLNDATYFFESPGDIVPISVLDAVITRPLDPEMSEWGIAIMDMQADLPDGDDSVRMVLFGGVEITPAQDQLVENRTTCEYSNSTGENINLRSGPGTNFRVVDILDRDDSLSVYGQSENGEWLRSSRGWIFGSIGELDCATDTLTTFVNVEDAYTAPMQAFTLQVTESAQCQATPPGLLIQVPDGQTANIMVNNVELRVGSTAFVTVATDDEDDDSLLVANIEGDVYTTSDEATQHIFPGSQSQTPLDENSQAAGPPSTFEPIDNTVTGIPTGLLTNTLPDETTLPEPLVLTVPTTDDQDTSVGTSDEVPLGEWGACGTCTECEGPDAECRINPSGACVWDPAGCNPLIGGTPSLSCSNFCGSAVSYVMGTGDTFVITLTASDGAVISDAAANTGGLSYVFSGVSQISPSQVQVNFDCYTPGGPGTFSVDIYDSLGRSYQAGFTLTCT